jgi:hypothetical protein
MTSRTPQARRCCRAVAAVSEESPQRRAIDEEPTHHVVPALGLGTAERPVYPPRAPRAPRNGRALARLRVCLPTRVLLGRPMPLIGSPAVDARAREAKRLPQGCARQKDWLLPPSAHRGASLARVGSPGVPSPARMGCARRSTSRRARRCTHDAPPAPPYALSRPRPARDGGAARRDDAPRAGQVPVVSCVEHRGGAVALAGL